MADREQKNLDATVENMSGRLGDIRGTLATLIARMETNPNFNWTSFLDSQALISGQLNSLLKSIKNDRAPPLRRYTALPLLLSADRDEELLKLTEGRVAAFSHDLVPHYLRTKPEPEVENKYGAYETRVQNSSNDALAKQATVLEKITREALKVIHREKDDIESRAGSKGDMETTSSNADTNTLVAAISTGKLLRPQLPEQPPQQTNQQQMMGQGRQPGQGQPQLPKAPSSIKTNIKAASQVHPYSRN